MSPRLLSVAGPATGATLSLGDKAASIGRDPSNDFWIPDPALSRRHCIVVSLNDAFILRDLGSRNGTLVNGLPIQEHTLKEGDEITVGDSVLSFLVHDKQPQAAWQAVQFDETVRIEPSLLLEPEDALYRKSQALSSPRPHAARMSRDLNALLKIAAGIGGIRDQESLQWQLLGMVFDLVPAERAAFLLFDGTAEFNSVVAWDRVHGPGSPVRLSRTAVERVRQEGSGLVISDISQNFPVAVRESLGKLGIRSLLCVPLIISKGVVGAIYLDSSSATVRFDENHLQVMTAVAGITSLALDNVRHWERLRRENEMLRAEVDLQTNMLGNSPRMREVFAFIRRVAPTDSTVLIEGESGTGKEMVARALHRNSSRSDRPFVAINCAAITETLLESELFGHEKGAFTGAVTQKKGKIEAAEGGTLFLDEVGELAPGLQAKLLRVLQEREFERVGGTRTIKLDVRLIAATNKPLSQSVQDGAFRKDLYYRLNVVAVKMPALRERREDIPMLAEHFVARSSRKCKTRIKPLSAEAVARMVEYDWPGNVRELENAIERALVLGAADSILPEDLPEVVLESASQNPGASTEYLGTIKATKKQLILQALQQANGNYIEAAKSLGMHPNSLLRLIRNLDLKNAAKDVTQNAGKG